MPETLPHILLEVITHPTEAFRRLLVRRPYGVAAVLVLFPPMFHLIAQAFALRMEEGGDLDMAMRLGVMNVLQAAVVFCALVLLCHLGATQLANGSGKLSDMFLVAASICVIQIIEEVVVLTPTGNWLMRLVLFAWQVVLLVIGIKEVYKLTSMPAGLTGGVVKVAVSLFGWCLTLYALPYTIAPPFPAPQPGPKVSFKAPQELLRNTGFEQFSQDARGRLQMEHWYRMGAIPLGVWGVEWGKDQVTVGSGKTSALIADRWLPVGVYVGWMQSAAYVLRPGEHVRCSARIRTKDADVAVMTLSFTEAQRRERRISRGPKAGYLVKAYVPTRALKGYNTPLIRGDTDWKEYTLTAVVPKPEPRSGTKSAAPSRPSSSPNIVLAHVGIGFWGRGTVWIDDVSLTAEAAERELTYVETPPPAASSPPTPSATGEKTKAVPSKKSPQEQLKLAPPKPPTKKQGP